MSARIERDKYVEAMVKSADANGDAGVSFSEARIFKMAKWLETLGEVEGELNQS
jgi:hypothetical protein